MDQKIPVSIAIVTENEECNIRQALESASDFEEIVVVDSFSTDRTVEICRDFTGRVFQSEWKGYAAQKQRAVDLTSLPWVLILDADERITAELKEEIRETTALGRHAGYYIPRKNYFLGKWIRHSGWWPDHTLRLFRKEVSGLEMREVHEKVVVRGETGYLTAPMEHYSYRSLSDYVRKMENYSTLSAREILSAGSRSPLLPMVVNPVAVFFKMYLLRQGFRDGAHGLVLAGLYSFYTFLKYAKVWEKQR